MISIMSSGSAPRTARGRKTRKRIVEAAAELMHLKGVNATSVDDVLEASGTGKGQFYHYFGDKSRLVQAVLQYQLDRGLEADRDLLERLDHWNAIRAWFDSILEDQVASGFAGGCPIGSMAAEMADQDESLRLDLESAFRLKGRYLLDGLSRMQAQGRLQDEADPEALSEFAVAVIQGGLLLSTTSRSAEPLKHALDHAFDHLRSFAGPRGEP